MSWRTAILTTCLGLAAFAGAACGGGGQDGSAERADDAAPAPAADAATPLDAPTNAGPRDDAASAPAEVLYQQFGLTAQRVAEDAASLLGVSKT